MARLALVPKTLLGSFPALPVAALALTVTPAAPGLASDGVSTPYIPGKSILYFQNTDVGAQTVTISSTADQRGRTGDVTTYALAAGAIGRFGPFESEGWRQADTFIYAVASHIGVKFWVDQLP